MPKNPCERTNMSRDLTSLRVMRCVWKSFVIRRDLWLLMVMSKLWKHAGLPKKNPKPNSYKLNWQEMGVKLKSRCCFWPTVCLVCSERIGLRPGCLSYSRRYGVQQNASAFSSKTASSLVTTKYWFTNGVLNMLLDSILKKGAFMWSVAASLKETVSCCLFVDWKCSSKEQ